MEGSMKTQHLRLGGMTCMNCENHIRERLLIEVGIQTADVSYKKSSADITYDETLVTFQEIKKMIEEIDYQVLEEDIINKKSSTTNIVGIIVILFAAYTIMRRFGITNLFNAFPQAEENMGYGMLFIIGLLTSVHCVAMCGGINLSQCIPQSVKGDRKGGRFSSFRPSFLYNAGRVISYTVVGAIVGALGSVVSFTGSAKGIVQIGAGVFMVIMGLNMLNVHPALRKLNLRMPRFLARKVYASKAKASQNNLSPLYVGLINGLMPCGPLQAMQLYALSTGSPVKGAVSMFLFSLGTVPLMFGLGALSSVLSKKFTNKVMAIGSVFVIVLGISMLRNGFALSGVAIPNITGSQKDSKQAQIVDGVQIVNTSLASGRYEPITVQAGIPVKWTITAEKGTINGCNNRIIIPEYKLEKSFEVGENVILFTPKREGTFTYSCWMGMIRSTITVYAEGDEKVETQDKVETQGQVKEDSKEIIFPQISITPTQPGAPILTDEVALGEIVDGIQYITITRTDTRFTPAVIVLQEGIETRWTIKTEEPKTTELEIEDYLLFPFYNAVFDSSVEEQPIFFYPSVDFEFSSENKFFGYVKVVSDLDEIDLETIRSEVSNYQTTIWDYNNLGGSGASCH